MTIRTRRALAILGAAAMALPTAAVAAPGGKAPAKKNKPVTYIVKGVYDASDSSVTVSSGNSHARRGGLIGDRVVFDFSRAKVRAADTNGDAKVSAEDLVTGEKVKVQARLPRLKPGSGPFLARKVIDRTNPPVDSGSEAGESTD